MSENAQNSKLFFEELFEAVNDDGLVVEGLTRAKMVKRARESLSNSFTLVSSVQEKNKREQQAIAFGKLLAFYSMGLVDDNVFYRLRRELGY